jgi:very-short-patch-repair endonuclease
MVPMEAALSMAAAQHGAISLDQLVSAGLGRTTIQRLMSRGHFERVHPGVLRSRGAPDTWLGRLSAARLWCGEGAAVSHGSAGALWQLDGVTAGAIELSVVNPRDRRCDGVRVHRTLDLSAYEIASMRGIAVTDVVRTVIDLAGAVTRGRLERIVDDALVRRIATAPRLAGRLDALGRRGRKGAGRLRVILEERLGGIAPTESELERRLATFLRTTVGLAVERQHPVRRQGRIVARLDFALPEHRVAIEADGHRWHGSFSARRRDGERDAMLSSLGWRVVRVTWTELEHEPAALAGRLRSVTVRAA